MTSIDAEPEVEVLRLRREDAERLALASRDAPDPFSRQVRPSLLAAHHIKDYVLKAGLVAPFYTGGGKNSRLKRASYEGRIGTKAFTYVGNDLVSVLFERDCLEIPANSIVFVESDLDFRLPKYIGLRFNLQIRHVHRGLLLGTGPLIDPGYWGKLCIPLHNLTSRPYRIPLNEGLIWLEFTKTTFKEGTDTGGADPRTSNTWDIETFIRKASREFTESTYVPIQSSITETVGAAEKKFDESLSKAESASQLSVESRGIVTQLQGRIQKVAVLGAVVGVAGIGALLYSHYTLIATEVSLFKSYVDAASAGVEEMKRKSDDLHLQVQALEQKQKIDPLVEQMSDLWNRLRFLEEKNSLLEAEVNSLKTKQPVDQPQPSSHN